MKKENSLKENKNHLPYENFLLSSSVENFVICKQNCPSNTCFLCQDDEDAFISESNFVSSFVPILCNSDLSDYYLNVLWNAWAYSKCKIIVHISAQELSKREIDAQSLLFHLMKAQEYRAYRFLILLNYIAKHKPEIILNKQILLLSLGFATSSSEFFRKMAIRLLVTARIPVEFFGIYTVSRHGNKTTISDKNTSEVES